MVMLALVPANDGKAPEQGKAQAYVCKFGVCLAPVTTVEQLKLK